MREVIFNEKEEGLYHYKLEAGDRFVIRRKLFSGFEFIYTGMNRDRDKYLINTIERKFFNREFIQQFYIRLECKKFIFDNLSDIELNVLGASSCSLCILPRKVKTEEKKETGNLINILTPQKP